MYNLQKHYGKGFYQGDRVIEYNQFLLDYAKGEVDSQTIKDSINSETAWTEIGYGIYTDKQVKQQVLLMNVEAESFETDSNLVNEIWAEISDRHLFFNSDYYEVLIYYNEETEKNKVSILSVDFTYIEES
jgi:hypothetical protein